MTVLSPRGASPDPGRADTGADLLYSDEVLTGEDLDDIIEVRARPVFSHDFYLSHPYFVHMVSSVRSWLTRWPGHDETLPISAVTCDFVPRAIERANALSRTSRGVLDRCACMAAAPGTSGRTRS